jgi:hypothetical protein
MDVEDDNEGAKKLLTDYIDKQITEGDNQFREALQEASHIERAGSGTLPTIEP